MGFQPSDAVEGADKQGSRQQGRQDIHRAYKPWLHNHIEPGDGSHGEEQEAEEILGYHLHFCVARHEYEISVTGNELQNRVEDLMGFFF